jgi:hypothetical protein
MPEQLTDAEWKGLLEEQDEFRLAILGQNAIEAEIDTAIAELIEGPVPVEIGPSASFRIRLAVAVGLGVVTSDCRAAFTKLASVRNSFAHGKISSLDEKLAKELREAVYTLMPGKSDEDEWKIKTEAVLREAPPRASLVAALAAARAVVLTVFGIRLTLLEHEREALVKAGVTMQDIVRAATEKRQL